MYTYDCICQIKSAGICSPAESARLDCRDSPYSCHIQTHIRNVSLVYVSTATRQILQQHIYFMLLSDYLSLIIFFNCILSIILPHSHQSSVPNKVSSCSFVIKFSINVRPGGKLDLDITLSMLGTKRKHHYVITALTLYNIFFIILS